jgi:HK97 family phage portal protein
MKPIELRYRVQSALRALQGKQNVIVQRVTAGTQFPDVPLTEYMEHNAAYEVHPWIHACVRVIATTGAQAHLGMFKRRMFTDVNGMRLQINEPVPDHPLNELFRMPNVTMRLSRYDLLNNAFGYLELAGNSYWAIQRDDQTQIAAQLIPLRPDRVTPVPDRETFIAGYIYRVDGEDFAIDTQDMIHIALFNPGNDYVGLSTLSAARNTLEEDTFAQKYNTAFYKKGARPGGAISYDQQLSDEDYKQIRQQWEAAHRGENNFHRIAIFERGAKWQNYGISQVDADFIEARKMNREQISSVYGVPPVLINSYEHANYNTAKTQTQVFWRITQQPKLALLNESINVQISKLLGPLFDAVSTDDVFVDWDTSNVWAIQEEMREGIEGHTKLVNNGIMNRNEVRSRFYNLPPVDGGEKYFRAAGQTLITDETAGPSDQDDDDDDGDEENGNGNDNGNGDDSEASVIVVAKRSDIARLDLWKATTVQTGFLEKLFARFVRAIFKDQEEEVLRRLRAFVQRAVKDVPRNEIDIESVLFDLGLAQETTADASEAIYEKVMREGGRRGVALASLTSIFELDNPRAQAILLAKRQKFAEKVNDTTWRALKESLVAGMAEREGIAQLSQRVTSVMGTRGSKSLEIARTEVIGTYNGGIQESWSQAGTVVKGKEWLTSEDEAVRESHESINGEKIPTEARFEVFDPPALLFPGDPSGASTEIINCRCSMLPVLEEL